MTMKSLPCQLKKHESCNTILYCPCTCHQSPPQRGDRGPSKLNLEDQLHADHLNNQSHLETRPGRDQNLLDIARSVSQRGTCSRAKVGSVIARDGRIIATGYNGAPAGMPHCSHLESDSGCIIAEHAERNAIAYAARYGVGTDKSTLYSTHAPCIECARSIVNAGIIRVFYKIPYRLTDGLKLLRSAGVEVKQLT